MDKYRTKMRLVEKGKGKEKKKGGKRPKPESQRKCLKNGMKGNHEDTSTALFSFLLSKIK